MPTRREVLKGGGGALIASLAGSLAGSTVARAATTTRDAAATVLWSISTVHHRHDVDKGVAEAARVLVQGGRLLAIEGRAQPGATGHASHGWTRDQASNCAGKRCSRCTASHLIRRRSAPARLAQLGSDDGA